MKGSLTDDDSSRLLDTKIGTVQKLVKRANFQRVFDSLGYVLRLVF